MDSKSNTPEYDKFRRRCLDAVEGMKFFDQPVQDMTAAELLVVIGHLVTENVRLTNEAKAQHRCRWGDDESGPHFSDEYIESLERRLAFEEKAHRDGVIDLNVLYPNAAGRFYPPATREPPPAPPAPPKAGK